MVNGSLAAECETSRYNHSLVLVYWALFRQYHRPLPASPWRNQMDHRALCRGQRLSRRTGCKKSLKSLCVLPTIQRKRAVEPSASASYQRES
jgi:hypothetical protein